MSADEADTLTAVSDDVPADLPAASSTFTTTNMSPASTTTTTTGMFAPPARLMISVVTGPAIACRQVEADDISTLADHISELLAAHIAHGQGPAQGVLRLAQALPCHSDRFSEALLIWHPLNMEVQILVDSRAVGGGLRHVEVDSDQDPDELVETAFRRRGCRIYINGIPRELCQRLLHDGDLITVASGSLPIPAFPRSAFFRRWPLLGLLALDIATPDLGRTIGREQGMVPTLQHAVLDALENHAIRLGYWLSPASQALVLNRCRGEILVHVCSRLPASRNQVCEALQLIDLWRDIRSVLDTGVMSLEASVFLACDHYEMRSCWHLVPVPYLPPSYLLWQAAEDTVSQTAQLPAMPHLVVQATIRPINGHVHIFRRRDEPGPSGGTSLIQIGRQGHTDRARQDPCAALARHASPQRVRLCIKEFGIDEAEFAIRPPRIFGDLGSLVCCKADHLRSSMPMGLQISPADFDAEIDRAFLVGIRSALTLGDAPLRRCTIFDVRRHHTIRFFDPSERPEFLIADILLSAPEQVRRIHLLHSPVPGFPTPQFTVTFARAFAGWNAVPFDGRNLGFGLCTIDVWPRATWFGLGGALVEGCATAADCTGFGEEVSDRADTDRLILRTPLEQVPDPLPFVIEDIEYIRVSGRAAPPPLPEDSDSEAPSSQQSTAMTGHVFQGQHAQIIEPPIGRATTEAPEVAKGKGTRRSIATPCGRRCVPVPTAIMLQESLPQSCDPIQKSINDLRALQTPWLNFWFKDINEVPDLPPGIRAFLQELPAFGSAPNCLHIFTDGSFSTCHGKSAAGWAVVAVLETATSAGTQWHLVGFRGGSTTEFACKAVGAEFSSYSAELQAAIVTCAWLLSVPTGHPVSIWTDNSAVFQILNGTASPGAAAEGLTLAERLRNMAILCREHGIACQARWLPGHAGNPFNELADRVEHSRPCLLFSGGWLPPLICPGCGWLSQRHTIFQICESLREDITSRQTRCRSNASPSTQQTALAPNERLLCSTPLGWPPITFSHYSIAERLCCNSSSIAICISSVCRRREPARPSNAKGDTSLSLRRRRNRAKGDARSFSPGTPRMPTSTANRSVSQPSTSGALSPNHVAWLSRSRLHISRPYASVRTPHILERQLRSFKHGGIPYLKTFNLSRRIGIA